MIERDQWIVLEGILGLFEEQPQIFQAMERLLIHRQRARRQSAAESAFDRRRSLSREIRCLLGEVLFPQHHNVNTSNLHRLLQKHQLEHPELVCKIRDRMLRKPVTREESNAYRSVSMADGE